MTWRNLISACLLISLQACSPKVAPTKTAVYQSTPLVMDGLADDWKNITFGYDPYTTFHYAITNDSADVYLCFTTTSDALERKVFHTGLKVFIDTSSERRQIQGIEFPMPIDESAMQLMSSKNAAGQNNSMDDYRKFILLQENQFESFGFPGNNNGMNALNTHDIVTIGFNLGSDGIFVYEMKIPFSSLFPQGNPSDLYTREFVIGVLIEGLQGEDSGGQTASEIGMPGSQMTGARIGMGKGGGLQRNGYGAYNNAGTSREQRSWLPFKLAQHP